VYRCIRGDVSTAIDEVAQALFTTRVRRSRYPAGRIIARSAQLTGDAETIAGLVLRNAVQY
jgi:hypothetical protein